jgi:hypothetical protein
MSLLRTAGSFPLPFCDSVEGHPGIPLILYQMVPADHESIQRSDMLNSFSLLEELVHHHGVWVFRIIWDSPFYILLLLDRPRKHELSTYYQISQFKCK